MSLLNFDTELDVLGVTRIHVEHVAKPRLATETSHHMAPVDDWGWREVMDYVLTEIERRLGPQDHNVAKEQAIFKRFCKTWGADAGRIARYAFEVKDGWWAEGPVELWRFSTGADPYFAVKIADKLRGGENFVR